MMYVISVRTLNVIKIFSMNDFNKILEKTPYPINVSSIDNLNYYSYGYYGMFMSALHSKIHVAELKIDQKRRQISVESNKEKIHNYEKYIKKTQKFLDDTLIKYPEYFL